MTEIVNLEEYVGYVVKVVRRDDRTAEMKHCYEYEEYYTPSAGNYDNAFDDGADYGEITFARTLLEQIGEKFDYPMMKEND